MARAETLYDQAASWPRICEVNNGGCYLVRVQAARRALENDDGQAGRPLFQDKFVSGERALDDPRGREAEPRGQEAAQDRGIDRERPQKCPGGSQ